jgi:serine/threonine protein kinase
LIDGRYEAIRKLGWGEFSTVWLVFDHKARNGHKAFAALKAAKCRADIVQNTKYECNLLAFLRDARKPGIPICSINQTLEQRGQYGTHLCLTMPVLGPNLLCMVDYMKARRRRRSETEVQLMKEITTAVLKALDHLAHLNVMHTDLKPENVMVSAPDPKLLQAVKDFLENKQLPATMLQSFADGDPFSSVVTVADFGLSILLEPAATPQARQLASHRPPNVVTPGILSNTQVGMLMQTREYRAIEVLFGTDLNCRTDLWSLGCMVYELVTGDFLLNPKRKTRVEREMDIEHVAMIMQLLGPVPARIARGAGRFLHRYFDTNTGAFLYAERYRNYQRRSIAAELSLFLEQQEAERCAQFIMACFSYDPAERPTAHELLKHPWLRASML